MNPPKHSPTRSWSLARRTEKRNQGDPSGKSREIREWLLTALAIAKFIWQLIQGHRF
ncbi:MAG: hypothetical protein ACREQI_15795 [Candidatus Binataceae bacterium]